jgi:hypothetical protein
VTAASTACPIATESPPAVTHCDVASASATSTWPGTARANLRLGTLGTELPAMAGAVSSRRLVSWAARELQRGRR